MAIRDVDWIREDFQAFVENPVTPATACGRLHSTALRRRPALTVLSATVLAIEALVFLWVHARYGEIGSMAASGVLGLLMAFLAYGRRVLRPIR